LHAFRRCGLSAAESPAAIGTSTASWRGTLDAPGIRVCGGCELAAIVGSAPLTPSALSAAGARRPGVVSLAFSIDRHGNVVSSRIVKSSGSTVLDAEALDLLKRAAPLPPPPAEIADSELSFVVPIRFVAGSKR